MTYTRAALVYVVVVVAVVTDTRACGSDSPSRPLDSTYVKKGKMQLRDVEPISAASTTSQVSVEFVPGWVVQTCGQGNRQGG